MWQLEGADSDRKAPPFLTLDWLRFHNLTHTYLLLFTHTYEGIVKLSENTEGNGVWFLPLSSFPVPLHTAPFGSVFIAQKHKLLDLP